MGGNTFTDKTGGWLIQENMGTSENRHLKEMSNQMSINNEIHKAYDTQA